MAWFVLTIGLVKENYRLNKEKKMTLKDELLKEFKNSDIVRPENFHSRLSFNFKGQLMENQE